MKDTSCLFLALALFTWSLVTSSVIAIVLPLYQQDDLMITPEPHSSSKGRPLRFTPANTDTDRWGFQRLWVEEQCEVLYEIRFLNKAGSEAVREKANGFNKLIRSILQRKGITAPLDAEWGETWPDVIIEHFSSLTSQNNVEIIDLSLNAVTDELHRQLKTNANVAPKERHRYKPIERCQIPGLTLTDEVDEDIESENIGYGGYPLNT